MWMDDVEKAIDAYRVWLETKIEVEDKYYYARLAFEEALRVFDVIFKAGEDEQDLADVAESLRDYTPGEGISISETLARMREEGKL